LLDPLQNNKIYNIKLRLHSFSFRSFLLAHHSEMGVAKKWEYAAQQMWYWAGLVGLYRRRPWPNKIHSQSEGLIVKVTICIWVNKLELNERLAGMKVTTTPEFLHIHCGRIIVFVRQVCVLLFCKKYVCCSWCLQIVESFEYFRIVNTFD
jgi:hypothetical protein